MATSKEYLNFILEQLSEAGQVRARAMMGEYVIYYREKVIGGLYDNRFLIKEVQAAQKILPAIRYEIPYDGAKAMISVDDIIDDQKLLKQLLEGIYDELPPPKPKKAKGCSRKAILH